MGPILAIVGETGSGKSSLAIELAQRFNGEVICADSRTVYRDMDIATAKPSAVDRSTVPHHLLDLVHPDQPFNAAMFKSMASAAIADIQTRKRLPIIAGGTGMYIDALLYDYSFAKPADPAVRKKLSRMKVDELRSEILKKGLDFPQNFRNPRHLQRVLELGDVEAPEKKELRANTLIIGITLAREILQARIGQRIDAMFDDGVVEEARTLLERYGKDAEACKTPGYRALFAYIEGDISREEAKLQFTKSDLQLAKRQRTWFKRNNSIHWLSDPSDAVALVTTFLSK